MSPKWSLLLRFSDKNFVRISHVPMRATSTAHSILCDFITLVILCVEYKL
jgi:hypothetical protein